MRTKTTLAVRLDTRVTRVTRVDSPKTLSDALVFFKRENLFTILSVLYVYWSAIYSRL